MPRTDVGCTDTIVKTIEVYELPTSNFSYTSDCSTNQIILDFTDQSTSNDPLNFWFYDFGVFVFCNVAAEPWRGALN